jgi:hypothetical protein
MIFCFRKMTQTTLMKHLETKAKRLLFNTYKNHTWTITTLILSVVFLKTQSTLKPFVTEIT